MTHPVHTPASTDPDRTAAPDRLDPDSTRDAPASDRLDVHRDASTSDRLGVDRDAPTPGRTPVRPSAADRDRRTFPAAGYDGRTGRARADPMAVWALRDGRYLVDTDGGTYVVDAARAVCDCPDNAIRGARCKHLRRVTLEIRAGLVPAPDRRERPCAVCGGAAFVDRDADGPALCARHDHQPGAVVADRETGDRLVVVGPTGERADEARTDEGRLVADYDTNAAYGRHEPAIAARYVGGRVEGQVGLDSVSPTAAGLRGRDRSAGKPRRYLFPASRLRPVDGGAATDRPARPAREEIASSVRAG